MRKQDGSAGDADYGAIGGGYRNYRQPEPAFEAAITQALGEARTVINVGAGAGSYEPADRTVTAVEPSASMRAQRPTSRPVAIDATAEELPFDDDTFDAAMTTFSIHQWGDLEAGLGELRRVSRGPVVIMTADPARVHNFWLMDYAPQVLDTEARRYPAVDRISAALGGSLEVRELPIPLNCRDGFSEAYYGRPECFLEPARRKANSAWSFVDQDEAERAVQLLGADLENGSWDSTYGQLRSQPAFDGSLVLITARP